jgi:hypothetical protein
MLFFPHTSLKMCSVRHLLNINSSPVRIFASSEKKLIIREALLDCILMYRTIH